MPLHHNTSFLISWLVYLPLFLVSGQPLLHADHQLNSTVEYSCNATDNTVINDWTKYRLITNTHTYFHTCKACLQLPPNKSCYPFPDNNG